MLDNSPNPIILYDGVCGFCNRTVQFILRRDSHDRFRFAALQSDFARSVLEKQGINPGKIETLYLVLDHGLPTERVEQRSDAAISILRELGFFWRALANLGAIFPRGIRDWEYNLIARYRYRIFGKYDSCPLPLPGDRGKFLDLP
jgi:predicted DCC family thiol-disulfide oxidoreductase YuxK